MNFTPSHQAQLDAKIETLQGHAKAKRKIAANTWSSLVESEQLLIDLMGGHPPAEDAPGKVELSWILYALNHELPKILTEILQSLDMPKSQIQSTEWASWAKLLANEGVLNGDGTLLAEARYAQIDPGWLLAAIDYFILKDLHWPVKLHPFSNSPAQIPNLQSHAPTRLRVAVLGDCGTGSYPDGNLPDSPSQLILEQIKGQSPDVIIHLGDVYYTGTSHEETHNLVNCWPAAPLGNFTMNSNHEMYDGANGLFKTALGSRTFQGQQGTTYFSLEWGDWLIVGLDSAYYDESSFFMVGALRDPEQIAFLQAAMATGKQVIIMTHHCGMEFSGGATTPLWQDVAHALKGNMPAYWYWGHEHNGIVYGPQAACGDKIKCRCLGNAAIPIGNASWLENIAKSVVPFYTNAPLENPTKQQELRVKNGYALLDLDANGLTETWFYQDGTQAWSSTDSS